MHAALTCVVVWSLCGQAGQDAALRDRVTQLVEKLKGADVAERDMAEKALIAIGPRLMPLLTEAATKGADDDAKTRLGRVKQSIEEAQEKAMLGPSRVTIKGEGLRLSDVLRDLQRQTGNPLTDLREAYGAEASNPVLDLDIKDQTFFEALAEIAKKGSFGITFQTGDGSIGIVPADGMYGATEPGKAARVEPPVKLVGPFRVTMKNLSLGHDLSMPKARASALFEVAWEPRLRPMLLALKADELEITDDRGEKVEPEVAEESTSTVLRPENPSADVYLNMIAPDRKAQVIKMLSVKSTVTLPAGLRQFRFKKLDEKDAVQTQGDVKMTLESTEVEENVWRVRVLLEMPGEGPAFESYQQGLFNNRLWLQKADGSRFEHNGGFSTTSVAPGRLGFEYLFVDAPGKPGDYEFVYETPSRVIALPLEFTFENVQLP
jgi:hypothetical protein